MLQIQYRIKTKRWLNLQSPERYTEKLQWYKLYYRDPLMATCADKYQVREYIENKGLNKILNPIYGLYESADEIDFDNLPKEFVLKATNGAGGNNIIICTDKSSLNIEMVKREMKDWVKKQKNGGGREWLYYKYPPRIIAEHYLSNSSKKGLIDYKFFCFYGRACYVYIITDRQLAGDIKLGIFNLNYEILPYYRGDEKRMTEVPSKPGCFNEMIEIAEKLAEDFPHVRVDLYEIENHVVFGELTFFDGSGYQTFEPDEFDFILGEKFKLPKRKAVK